MNKWAIRYFNEADPEGSSGAAASTGDEPQASQESLLGAGETVELDEGEIWLIDGVKAKADGLDFFDSSRFKTLADQAKSYRELEKKFGSFTGAPKDGYKPPEGVEPDDALFVQLKEFAESTNMNQEGFDKAWELLTAQSQAAEEANIEAELAKLGNDAPARIANVNKFLQNNLKPEEYEELKNYVTTAEDVKLVEALMRATAPAKLPVEGGENPEGITQEMIQEAMFKKDEQGRLLRSIDPAYDRKVRDMMRKFYGDGEHHIVVG